MSVYKSKDNSSWVVKFQYKDWSGERKWVTKRGFSTKREAQTWERSFMEKLKGTTNMLFKDFVVLYLEGRGPRLKESTSATKANIIEKQILPYFGERKLSEISSNDVIQWQNTLLRYRDPKTGKAYSPSYLKTVHNQLSAIFNYAVRYFNLKENPARKAGNMGTDKNIHMKYWTLAQYQRFAEAVMAKPLAYYCFEVLYWCGIREGELLALTPEDVDLEAGTLTVNKTFQHLNGKDLVTEPKTPTSNRTVVMPDFLCAELTDYMKMLYALHPTDRLFPVSKSSLNRAMEYGCKEAGLDKIRIHDLRHSHVSLLIDQGFSAVAIAARVGHKSEEITYRYAHLFPTAQPAMAKKLDSLAGGCHVG